ncbi:MAG: tryptophan-rich sensory protein [Candidatus Pacearchaeota archaeon]|nr:tryptophan-rich sensory protein [Candidatus Pacearchaeota archaeon]
MKERVKQVKEVKKKSKINWKVLISCFIIVAIVAFLGSTFTSQNTNSQWYQSIKPSITPPNYVFPIVWTILFILIAISLYLSWIDSKDKTKIVVIFSVNFLLNILWSIFYFGMRNPRVAFIEIIFLWLSIFWMLVVTRKFSKKAFWLLIPYFIWVTFAAVLNFLSI